MNLCYFFVSNQNYKFVHSSDPIFGNEKNYRTEHFLQEVIFQIRTSERAAVSVLKETSKQRMKIRTERTSLKILKNFSSKHTSKKNEKLQKFHLVFVPTMKKIPAKRFKKESYFCAIGCFIAEFYSFFDTPNSVSKSWPVSELNNSSVIDFADQLVFQFFRDLRNSVSYPWTFLSYKRLGNFCHKWI